MPRQWRPRPGLRSRQPTSRNANGSQGSRHLVLTRPRQRLNHPIECLTHVSVCDRSMQTASDHRS